MEISSASEHKELTMGPLTWKYIKVVLLLWIQLVVYPCSFAKSTQNTNTICPPNFKPLNVESLSNCSIKLSNDSNDFEYALRNRISWEDGTIQRINTDMKIPKDYKTNKNHKMILPNKWLLAYIDPDGPFNFVSWSSDFKVLSLGLLSDENNEPIRVKINETAGICDVEIGCNYMITEIVKLFTDFIREKVELDRHYDYENIHLCYLSKFEWFKKSPWYLAKRLFGIPFQEFGYKCCMVREETVCCDDKLHRVEGYRLLPYIISIFLLSYSPILLMRLANFFDKDDFNTSQKTGSKRTSPSSGVVSVLLRFPFFLRFCDYKDTQINRGGDNKNLIYDGSIQDSSDENDEDEYDYDCSLEYSCCVDIPSCNCDCPESFDNRFFNWFFKRLKRLTFLLLFPSMIYFEFIILKSDVEWSDLLQTIGKDDLLFGFPTMFVSINNIKFLPPEGPMGALIIYYVLGFFIIVFPKDFENSVLGKGISVFQKNQALKNISKGYLKIKKVLQNFMYLPLNAVFWKRGKGCLMKVCIFIFSPLFVFPIIPFSSIALVGWIRYISTNMDLKLECKLCNNLKIFGLIFLKIFVLICLILVFMIFYGIFVVMLSYSIYLLFYILFFTSLGFIMSPNKKSKILIFIVGAIVFEYQIIRDSIHFYTELFHLIIEICESDNSLKEKYITDHEKGQCINENLVVEVFRKIRPAFVQTGHAIIKTVIVILIYASALTFMLKFNDKLSDVIERLTILITSVTPIILQWRFKTICPKRKRVELIIRQCVKEAEQKAKQNKTNAEEGEVAQNHEEAARKSKEAEQKAKEAVQKAKEAERITQEAKEAERNAKETERNAKEAERKAKINELKSKEHELKAKEAELKAKEAELNTKKVKIDTEDKLKTREDELNTKQALFNIKEDELNIKWAEQKAKEANVEEFKRKSKKDYQSIP